MSRMTKYADLTISQVAVILKRTSRHVLNLVNRGRFPNAYKMDPGSKSIYLIPRSDVDAFIKLQKSSVQKSKDKK